jgi:hypothetical protein
VRRVGGRENRAAPAAARVRPRRAIARAGADEALVENTRRLKSGALRTILITSGETKSGSA